MEGEYQVDLDREAVFYEGEWCTTTELAERIKRMIDSQDFRIGAAGAALEHLQQALRQVRSFSVKFLDADAGRLEKYAGQAGKSVEAYIRQAVQAYLAAQPPLPESADAEAPAAQLSTVTTEPANPDEAQQAVELTNKKADGALPKVLVDPSLGSENKS